jgi:hypothetical protein
MANSVSPRGTGAAGLKDIYGRCGSLGIVCAIPAGAIGTAVEARAFPYLSGAGRLVLKDVLLLAGAWLVMADSARALLATWVSAAPSRGRTESRLQGAALPINAEGRRNDAVPRPIYEYIP